MCEKPVVNSQIYRIIRKIGYYDRTFKPFHKFIIRAALKI